MSKISDIQDKQFRMKKALNKLEREKRLILLKLKKTRRDLEKLKGVSIPKEIITKLEDKINNGQYLQRIIKRRFAAQAQHGPESKPWDKLTPRYKAWKARQGLSTRILVATGVLKEQTIETVAGTFKFGKIPNWKASDIPVDYAVHADTARPFFDPPTKKEMEEIYKVLEKELKKELDKYARRTAGGSASA